MQSSRHKSLGYLGVGEHILGGPRGVYRCAHRACWVNDNKNVERGEAMLEIGAPGCASAAVAEQAVVFWGAAAVASWAWMRAGQQGSEGNPSPTNYYHTSLPQKVNRTYLPLPKLCQ